MRKIIVLVMVLVLTLSMSACGSGKTEDGGNGTATVTNLEGTLPEIIDKIYEVKNTNLSLVTMEVDVTNPDDLPYYTGLTDASKIKGVAVSESAFGSQAYSLVLVRLNDAADAEEVAGLMKDNIDTRKWICVEADDVRVAAYGDVVMFIMTSTEFEDSASAVELVEAFKSVCGGELSVDMAK